MPVLEAQNLRKSYRSRGKLVEAVRDVSLHIDAGEVFSFLGPNGAGKTTTIKMIAGLVWPDTGCVHINGLDPYRDPRALREMGAVLEGNRNTYWRLTPIENLEYFGVLRGLTRAQSLERGRELLDRFELAAKANTPVQALSRGMQQKLAIAMSIMHRPRLLLLDEPTLGLDVESSEVVKKLVREFAAEGHSILLTTHQLDVAEELSDRVAIIRQGKIVVEKPTKELITEFSGEAFAIEFSGELSPAQRESFTALGAIIHEHIIELICQPEDLYDALQLLKPLPLVRVERDNADLTEIFLKLIKGEPHD